MSDPVETFVREAQTFIDRHPALDEQQQTFGGLTWGLMRALAECPHCPGVYRVPVGPEADPWLLLVCPQCGGRWRWEKPEQQSPSPKAKAKAKAAVRRTMEAP